MQVNGYGYGYGDSAGRDEPGDIKDGKNSGERVGKVDGKSEGKDGGSSGGKGGPLKGVFGKLGRPGARFAKLRSFFDVLRSRSTHFKATCWCCAL